MNIVIGTNKLNTVLEKGAKGTRGVPDGSGPEGKGPTGRQKPPQKPVRENFDSDAEYEEALRKWSSKEGSDDVTKSIKDVAVILPSQLLKSQGASPPESPKKGSTPTRVQGRKPIRPPYFETNINVSGMNTNANYLKLTPSGEKRPVYLKMGTAHGAKFDNKNNCVAVKVDGKKYPVQNHLVKLPSGVYKIKGMVSVANKVFGSK